MSHYYILCDIGGTHSTFSLIEKEKEIKEIFRHTYQTNSYNNFEDIINNFLEEIRNHNIDSFNLVIAAAGPLNNEKIKLTNSPIEIIKSDLEKKEQFEKVVLINDFRAISYSTFNVKEEKLKIINKGEPYGENILVVGAGTGLGVSFIQDRDILDSEAGHKIIKDLDEYQDLIEDIKKISKKNQIEWEDMLSGRGLENIYTFHSDENLSAKEISKQKNSNKNARKTFEIFFKLYAIFTRELCIEHLIQKEAYLAGGIIENNLDFDFNIFLKEFNNSDTHKDFLNRIPIKIIKNYDTSIIGLENFLTLKENL